MLLSLRVSEMMRLIKDKTVEADEVKRCDRVTLTEGNVPVSCEDDFVGLEVCEGELATTRTMKHQGGNARDVVDDGAPLVNEGEWQDDECSGELVDHHCSYNLNSLSKSHLVGKQAAFDTTPRCGSQLLLQKPVHTLNLVALLPQVLESEPAQEALKGALGWNVSLQMHGHPKTVPPKRGGGERKINLKGHLRRRCGR